MKQALNKHNVSVGELVCLCEMHGKEKFRYFILILATTNDSVEAFDFELQAPCWLYYETINEFFDYKISKCRQRQTEKTKNEHKI